jgi:raffinose/stachyose/melibiose transport system permease protein
VSAVADTPRGPVALKPRIQSGHLAIHGVLLFYTFIALAPVLMIVGNSFKSSNAIFDSPFVPPTPSTFDKSGYSTVFSVGHFGTFFENSLFVTVGAVFLVVLLSSMAAFALSEYRFFGNTALALFFAIGIMIPIRLGSVSILKLTKRLGLLSGDHWPGFLNGGRFGPLVALVLIYTAMGIPLGIFLISQFMRQVPADLKNAARVDGAGEFRLFRLVIPLVRPGMAAVAVFTMLPVWNDLWFPLILTSGNKAASTVTLGAQQFLGQYASNWNAELAALTLAALPVIALYIVFSRQFLSGLTRGAID